jgi:hypothetical protein
MHANAGPSRACAVVSQLGSLLLVALDVVDQRSEYSKATSIMVLSQTYYVVVDVDPSHAFTAASGRARSASSYVPDQDADNGGARYGRDECNYSCS